MFLNIFAKANVRQGPGSQDPTLLTSRKRAPPGGTPGPAAIWRINY